MWQNSSWQESSSDSWDTQSQYDAFAQLDEDKQNVYEQVKLFKHSSIIVTVNLIMWSFIFIHILTETFASWGPGDLRSYYYAVRIDHIALPITITILSVIGLAIWFSQIWSKLFKVYFYESTIAADDYSYRLRFASGQLIERYATYCKRVSGSLIVNAIMWMTITIEHSYFRVFSLTNTLPIWGYLLSSVIILFYFRKRIFTR